MHASIASHPSTRSVNNSSHQLALPKTISIIHMWMWNGLGGATLQSIGAQFWPRPLPSVWPKIKIIPCTVDYLSLAWKRYAIWQPLEFFFFYSTFPTPGLYPLGHTKIPKVSCTSLAICASFYLKWSRRSCITIDLCRPLTFWPAPPLSLTQDQNNSVYCRLLIIGLKMICNLCKNLIFNPTFPTPPPH
jgi:hypothetical protein